ncbi:MAG: 30S ribosomal protein S4e [Candidatus Aenigmarchaeota archaeon]|nr:30S ribosomal protein S4e [Candidatus Aenigmarchaeota archaeon]
MAHLKRYSMPEFWPLARKAESYVTTPMPGPHQKYNCIPLKVIVRDSLRFAETSAEARKILNAGKVLVDKKVRKEPRFPVGFMDVFEIPELQVRYRVTTNKRGLVLEKIKEEETGFKLCRITGKTTLKGGTQQLNLHDGRNILDKGSYRIGDSLLIEIPGQKIVKHYPLKKGEPALIIAGRNIAVTGRIKDIKERKSMLEKSTITIETEKGRDIETLKDYVMVGSLHEIPASTPEKEEEKRKEKEGGKAAFKGESKKAPKEKQEKSEA